MKVSNALLLYMRRAVNASRPTIHHTPRCNVAFRPTTRFQPLIRKRFAHNPADDPNWRSLADRDPQLVRQRSRHGPGLIVLAIIPLTAFILGSWQVQRLGWKSDLIARFEDRLVQPPLPLPPWVDPSVIKDFDYRRVFATGTFRHDQEMLIGPRLRDGENGYLVVTPLERKNGSKILVNRGWIKKDMKEHRGRERAEALPTREVTVAGLLREPWKKNLFTPNNAPEKGEFYFPDVAQMAQLTESQPVWIEETMMPDLYVTWDREAKGVPIGRPPEVNLRNNHTQYIFTWYGLAAATSVMFIMVLRGKGGIGRRARKSVEW